MKKRLLLNLTILVLALMILPHCGGGGGGGNTGPSGPTTAVLTLSTALTPTGVIQPNYTIEIYDITIALPTGVSLKTDPTSTNPQALITDTGVITAVGVAATGSTSIGTYAPTAGTVTTIISNVTNTYGFNYTGKICEVTCDIAAGYHPSASDFTLSTFTVLGYVHTHLGYEDDTVTDIDLTSQMSLTVAAVIK